jgi:hypothetical protein
LTSAAARVMAAWTDGSGAYGFSFDESFHARAFEPLRAPGT